MNDATVVDLASASKQDILSLDARRWFINEGALFDDVVVLLGLVLAGRLAAEVVAPALAQGGTGPGSLIRDLIASEKISKDDWTLLHRIWYRWKIPFGTPSLAWWQLFTSALRRVDNPTEATELFENWLESIEGVALPARVEKYAAITGVTLEQGVVVTDCEITDLAALAKSALAGAPLLAVASANERAIIEAAFPLATTSKFGDLPGPARTVANLGQMCLERQPEFGALGAQARQSWADLTAEDRTYILVHLEQRIGALEQVRLNYGNSLLDNTKIAEVLAVCRSKNPAEWSRHELCVATAIWIWQEAGFTIQELNHAEISLASLRIFLERRVAEYQRIVSLPVPYGLPLMELARQLSALRIVVERTHQRCLYFDGGDFERREFVIPKADLIEPRRIPHSLRAAMLECFGQPVPETADATVAWKEYLAILIDRGRTPTELMIALAEWAANIDDVWVDYAIFSVPMGVKLDEPWQLELDELFSYTAIRAGFDPKRAAVPLNSVGIRNAIGQRMRYNAVKKAQNYALIKRMTPQTFLLPDISIAEDAHYGGHYSTGVRHACRVPMTITYRGSAWRGIADIRLSRSRYDDASRFREADLVIASRYGAWATAIADEAYARGLLFDRKYCVNLDDGRNLAAKLGRA